MHSTIANAIEEWIDWAQNQRGMRTTTIHSYRDTFVRLGATLHPETTLQAISLGDLEAFQRRRRGRGVVVPAAATIKREVAELSHWFEWLHDRGRIAENPAKLLMAPSVHNERPKPVNETDWVNLWAHTKTDEERVMLGLGYFCGLRRAEICSLRTEQFTWHPQPRLVDIERKGGHKQTIPWASWAALVHERRPDLFPNPQDYLRSLQNLLGLGQGPLLRRWTHGGTFVIPNVLGKHLHRMCVRCGIDEVTPHQLRHSFVTNQIRFGIPIEDVSRNAGHRSINTTMRYVATEEDAIGKQVDILAAFGPTLPVVPRTVPRYGVPQ